ncbi:MAG: hypothetical protein R2702_02185 [Acidimicrobiales bacterium]
MRQAVDKQNEQARLAGGREVAAEPLLAIAERLLPDLRAAEWRDKAEAALHDLDELDLRDLRSVVVAAESGAKDDDARALAEQLRTGLAERVDKEQAAWIAELTQTLAEGRVVRALRLSSRPPKAGAPLPADLAAKLTEAAAGALTADTLPDRWATVLDALSFSPVRLTVAPASKPEAPSEELVAVVTRMADRVPKVAEAFGIEPSAAPARKRTRGGRGGRARTGGAPARPALRRPPRRTRRRPPRRRPRSRRPPPTGASRPSRRPMPAHRPPSPRRRAARASRRRTPRSPTNLRSPTMPQRQPMPPPRRHQTTPPHLTTPSAS